MKLKTAFLILLLAACAQGREAKRYQSGTLVNMDSVTCGTDEKSGNSLTGEIIGTDSAHKKTHSLLCQEYVLQTEGLTYRIRPKDDKHPVLLPVGEKAQFRLTKDKMALRVEDLDDKEREYIVVSMTPRSDARPSTVASSELQK